MSSIVKRYPFCAVALLLTTTLCLEPPANAASRSSLASPIASRVTKKHVRQKTSDVLITTPRGGGGKVASAEEEFYDPTWKEIFEIPIRIQHQKHWDAISTSKRVAMMLRPSVLHLTILSSLGPLMFRGAAAAAATGDDSLATTLHPLRVILWTVAMVSYHASHNMLNDYQDLEGDDSRDDSFRLAYGVHALQQKFVSTSEFFKVMFYVALPGIFASAMLYNTDLRYAFPWGFSALVLYTPLFKPIAMGEVLVYFVWGPLMAGFGEMAATGAPLSVRIILTSPISAFWGAIASGVILGKHTDKIGKSSAKTIPSLLGYGGGVLTLDALFVVLPYVLLAWAVSVGRFGPQGSGSSSSTIVPLGSCLAFIAFFNEGLSSLRLLSKGEPKDGPAITEPLKGTLKDYEPAERWPLYFVAALGWNAITMGYLAVVGAGFEWALRMVLKHLVQVIKNLSS